MYVAMAEQRAQVEARMPISNPVTYISKRQTKTQKSGLRG